MKNFLANLLINAAHIFTIGCPLDDDYDGGSYSVLRERLGVSLCYTFDYGTLEAITSLRVFGRPVVERYEIDGYDRTRTLNYTWGE